MDMNMDMDMVERTSTVVEGIEHGKESANGENIGILSENHLGGW